jgi:hypothetical protein
MTSRRTAAHTEQNDDIHRNERETHTHNTKIHTPMHSFPDTG